ncbi:MAG: hypothetical protein AB7J13_02655 [Pyrinomonadaceae bacterium]
MDGQAVGKEAYEENRVMITAEHVAANADTRRLDLSKPRRESPKEKRAANSVNETLD